MTLRLHPASSLLSYLSLCALGCALMLSGCTSPKGGHLNQAPVENRGAAVQKKTAVLSGQPIEFDNEAKPGYYTVKAGDTLIRIGLDSGQNWRDIAKWNQIDRPSQIEVGQLLRVVPPVSMPLASVPTALPMPVPSLPPTMTKPDIATKPASEEPNWLWPTVSGTVVAGFHESKNKGIDLGGIAGDPVFASAEGRVVYAGSGLRGYGNLVIIKHSEIFLSAYAHNQRLLVKEDQAVVKGQKIAEMGQSDSDQVKLHFEIRKQGKPVDPALYLPKR